MSIEITNTKYINSLSSSNKKIYNWNNFEGYNGTYVLHKHIYVIPHFVMLCFKDRDPL
jgi:hypothetical protein